MARDYIQQNHQTQVFLTYPAKACFDKIGPFVVGGNTMTTHHKGPKYSFIVNLLVLTLVFAIIFTLQHSKRDHTEPEVANVTELAEEPVPEPAPEPKKEYLPIPTTQPNKTVLILSKNKKETKETMSENIKFTELQPVRTVPAGELSVEILDGETARQYYLAINKTGLAKNTIEPRRNFGNFIPFEK